MRLMMLFSFALWVLSAPVNAIDGPEPRGEQESEEAQVIPLNGKTELMIAAREGHIKRVKELIAAEADVNGANHNGGTPLMYAALGGNLEIVRLLLDRGASVNATADNRWSALMIASAKGHTHIAQLLLERGADINLQDVYRWTPIMRAVHENRKGVVRLLLETPGIDINHTGENEITALHLAVGRGNADIVRMLIEHGARIGVRDATGRTPLDVATDRSDRDLIAVLNHYNDR